MLSKVFAAIIFIAASASASASASFDVFRPNNRPDEPRRIPGNRPGQNPASNLFRNPVVVAKRPGFEGQNLGNQSSTRTKVKLSAPLEPGVEPISSSQLGPVNRVVFSRAKIVKLFFKIIVKLSNDTNIRSTLRNLSYLLR